MIFQINLGKSLRPVRHGSAGDLYSRDNRIEHKQVATYPLWIFFFMLFRSLSTQKLFYIQSNLII
jgi:hypothetical protein